MQKLPLKKPTPVLTVKRKWHSIFSMSWLDSNRMVGHDMETTYTSSQVNPQVALLTVYGRWSVFGSVIIAPFFQYTGCFLNGETASKQKCLFLKRKLIGRNLASFRLWSRVSLHHSSNRLPDHLIHRPHTQPWIVPFLRQQKYRLLQETKGQRTIEIRISLR